MGLTIRVTGGFSSRVWDEVAMRQLALSAAALVQARAFDRGVGSDDRPHAPYTVRYRAFRQAKGYQVDPPNLTRTGRMRRSFRVVSVTARRAHLGLAGAPAVYGHFVQQRRPWMGASAADREALRRIVPSISRACLERNRRPL